VQWRWARRNSRHASGSTRERRPAWPRSWSTWSGTGGAIGIDASSTLQRLAGRLGAVRDLTVLTNGPETFRALQEHAGITALLTGGELDTRTGSLVGPLAARAAARRDAAPAVRQRGGGRSRARIERVDARGSGREARARWVRGRDRARGDRVESWRTARPPAPSPSSGSTYS